MRQFSRSAAILFGSAVAVCGVIYSSTTQGANALGGQPLEPNTEQAKQLVSDALRAEADGNLNLREADLKQALGLAPDLPEVHWQLGEVQRGDRWISTNDVEKETAKAGKMTEYRKLQDQAAATVEDQLKVARWCDKHGLDDEEKAHSLLAIQLDPNQPEAMRRLGLIKFHGQLISKSQLDQAKADFHQEVLDSKEWRDRLWKLRRQYEREPALRNDVLSQIRAITDVKAIPAMEAVLGDADAEPMIAAIESLSDMKDLKSTQSLVRFAVFADPTTARYAAAQALKSRDPYSYIPMLLSGLQEPIIGEYTVTELDRIKGGDIAQNRISYFQEQPDAYNLNVTFEHMKILQIGRVSPLLPVDNGEARLKANINAANAANLQRNKQISMILADVTDQKLGDDPKAWWSWWYAQNEFYEPPEKPVSIRTEETSVTRVVQAGHSCFVAGTPVWTTTGPMPIERICAGELVLSQNYETGELAYKPVLATTVRPEAPVLQTRVGSTVIKSLRGHPFWVDGIGWQMAKELKVGERLHTIDGAVSIDEVIDSDPAECFNLVVADFNTYFVGDAKLLVHDNTLRGLTTTIVPGLIAP